MEGFIFYSSFLEATKGLDNEQFGIVMRAITEYGINGTVPESMDTITKIVFTLVRPQIDANAKRREDGAKGGRPSKQVSGVKNHGSQNEKPVVSDVENHDYADGKPKEKEKVKEKVKVKDKDNKPSPSSDDDDPDLFEQFWAAYPKKVAKGDAVRAFKKTKPTKALLQTMIEAVHRGKRSAMWKRDNGRYIPNPATWLNGRRWEDDLTEDMGLPDPVAVKNRFHNFEERNDDIDAAALELSKKALGI